MKLIADCLCKAYGGQTVLENVSFSVESGETLAVVGRSGCGKTTLLRILAGFLPQDSGEIRMDDRLLTAPGKDRLMVFQSFDQLFPWYTLRQNVQYALRKTRPGMPKPEARALAARCLADMGLAGAEDKFPYQLSGGMKQRGALARAMAVGPKALLLDEPFSSLDVYSRESARASLETLKAATGAALVLVTHDLDEAADVATRIALMKAGKHGIETILANGGPDVTRRLRRLLRD